EEVQLQRLMQGRGLTESEARQRIRAQWSTEAKAAYADFIIDNAGDLAATEAQVGKSYAALRDCACREDAGPNSRAGGGTA
ncbi:MAG TPA: dephospho-CoA kinase, partial [Candidatus Acidoferrum sp.]|nr:dephospho-CoA kinase [Candidatus Acidoferrum sp.]